MICWYCYWGWPKPVKDIYDSALKQLNGNSSPLHFGPAHIVWEDENFSSAEWCIEHFNDYISNNEEDMEIVKWSLDELAKIPLNQRCTQPEDYDGEHPEKFPPVNTV